MKRILILSIALAFVVGALGVSYSQSFPPPSKNDAELCKIGMELFPEIMDFDSLGECVSTLRTGIPQEACPFAVAMGFFDNIGQCVSNFRPLPPPPPPPPE